MHSMLAICFRYTISYAPHRTVRHAYHFSTFYRISRANLALRLRRLWLTPFCLQTPHSINGEYYGSAKASSSNWDSRCKSIGPCYKECTILKSYWNRQHKVVRLSALRRFTPYPQLNAFHCDRKGIQFKSFHGTVRLSLGLSINRLPSSDPKIHTVFAVPSKKALILSHMNKIHSREVTKFSL
jgi:hypothetical protein